ncbi:MAG: hypothetical protein V4773_07140 [Verrucomicrobiota bacterium]
MLTSLVVLLVYQRRQVDATEVEVAEVERRINETRAQAGDAARRVRDTRQSAKSSRVEVVPVDTRRIAGTLTQIHTENPEMARIYFRPVVRKSFASLFVQGGLTPAQEMELEEILMRQGPGLERVPEGGTELDDPEQDVLLANARGMEVLAEVTQKFGAEFGTRFAEAVRTRDVHFAVDKLAVDLMNVGAPLSPAVSQSLTTLLLEAQVEVAPELRLRLVDLDWERVVQRAPTILSGTHLRAVEALRARALFDREYERVSGYVAEKWLPIPR